MKKILVITPVTHFKNQGAAQKDIYATIQLLKKIGYEVKLYTIHSPAQDEKIVRENARKLGIESHLFTPRENISQWFKRAIRNPALFDRAAAVFAELVENVDFKKITKEFAPDIIFSFCSYSWPVLKFAHEQGVQSVFRSHNFEASFFWESLNHKEKLNPFNWIRFGAKYRGEYIAAGYASKIAALPFMEISKYQKWQHGKTEVLTLIFLPESIRATRPQLNKKPIDLFFLGASYNVIFHRRGAELLITKIAPQVLMRAPGAFRFHICGGKLPEYLVKQCNQDTIAYEGYVPDLEEFLVGMDAAVFPVMTGKTMKGKVFETLCRAFPMVIPSIGLGGYNLRNEKEVLIANTVKEFVHQTLRLSDLKLREKLAKGAETFSQTEFSEETITNVMRKILQNTVI